MSRTHTEKLATASVAAAPKRVPKARIGFNIPDVRGTTNLMVKVINDSLLVRLAGSSELPLVVAEKTLQVPLLPSLTNAQHSSALFELPSVRSKSNIRDKGIRDNNAGFVYVVQGEADLPFCRKIVTCPSGTLAYMGPRTWRSSGYTPHCEREDLENANCDLLWIFMSPHGVNAHFCWSRGYAHEVSAFVFIPDTHFLHFVELLQEGISSPNALRSARMILWLIFDRLHRKLKEGKAFPDDSRVRVAATPSARADRVCESALRYIDANLAERLTLEKVARAIYVSRTKLALAFHEDTGETFVEYLTRRRIERAQELLTTTTFKVREVAFLSGFTNSQYFSEAFRKHVGMTPSEYIKRGLEK